MMKTTKQFNDLRILNFGQRPIRYAMQMYEIISVFVIRISLILIKLKNKYQSCNVENDIIYNNKFKSICFGVGVLK
jgi:hypothetical protein